MEGEGPDARGRAGARGPGWQRIPIPGAGVCAHVEASGALHVHEERVRALYEALELVAALLELARRVQEVNIAHRDLRLRRVRTMVRLGLPAVTEGSQVAGLTMALRVA